VLRKMVKRDEWKAMACLFQWFPETLMNRWSVQNLAWSCLVKLSHYLVLSCIFCFFLCFFFKFFNYNDYEQGAAKYNVDGDNYNQS